MKNFKISQNLKIGIFLTLLLAVGILIFPVSSKARYIIDWHYPSSSRNHSSSENSQVSVSASKSFVNLGETVTIYWSTQNVNTCSKTGAWSGYVTPNTSGFENIVINATFNYGITCNAAYGGIVYDSIQVSTTNFSYSYPRYSYSNSNPKYSVNSYNYNHSSDLNSGNISAAHYSSRQQSYSSSNRNGTYGSNVNLQINVRDDVSSSSFMKEIPSQPGKILDFKIEINNNFASKVGYLFVALPSRLSFVADSAYLNGVKLNQDIASRINLISLGGASSARVLTFQAAIAPQSSFSENITILSVNVSVKSADSSAYLASDYANVLVYKNGYGVFGNLDSDNQKNSLSDDNEGVVLGASIVNTGMNLPMTILISSLTGFIVSVVYYILFGRKSRPKENDQKFNAGNSLTEKANLLQ